MSDNVSQPVPAASLMAKMHSGIKEVFQREKL